MNEGGCGFRSTTINKPSGLDFGNCCGWGGSRGFAEVVQMQMQVQVQVQVQQYID